MECREKCPGWTGKDLEFCSQSQCGLWNLLLCTSIAWSPQDMHIYLCTGELTYHKAHIKSTNVRSYKKLNQIKVPKFSSPTPMTHSLPMHITFRQCLGNIQETWKQGNGAISIAFLRDQLRVKYEEWIERDQVVPVMVPESWWGNLGWIVAQQRVWLISPPGWGWGVPGPHWGSSYPSARATQNHIYTVSQGTLIPHALYQDLVKGKQVERKNKKKYINENFKVISG